jgi:peptide-methionine (R)-S-oxide reductase
LSDSAWQERLTDQQYRILRENGTEAAYTGLYDKHYEEGNYYCAACGALLFPSEAKFNSGCGWPAFSDVFDHENIRKLEDRSHGMLRTEVRCAKCDGHLGHVFRDGPPPTGLRYCINSAALRFEPGQQ